MKMIANRYRIDGLAGEGGFGKVYRGYDESMERNVAIKVVRSVGDREAVVLRSLDHKGLPRLYDLIRENGNTFMVMEWIEGTDLERYITSRGPLSEKKAVKIGLELLKILEYLHGLHPAVVYQDLKPSNIMLLPDGHIKLVDFGTALAVSYGDEVVNLAGTVGYGSPEQRGIHAPRHAGTRSDIYSWGAVMYSLVSGRMLNKPPYTMDKIRVAAPNISYGLARVIGRAVSRNEEDRYATALDVRRAILNSGYTDLAFRLGFMLLMGISAFPFLCAWYASYADGCFGILENAILHGNLKSVLDTSIVSRDLGLMLVTGGLMAAVFHGIQLKRFVRVNRSVFLSARHYPGLWMGALLAGVIFGTGVGGIFSPSVSYASELPEPESGLSGTESGLPETEKILPVSIELENGEKCLVRYDSAYSPDGDLKLVIDRETLEKLGNGSLLLEYDKEDSGLSLMRIINLQIEPTMW
ncbi:MAG: serine/threonine protein kinase [Lachnospiraceae bacterium]|nr:serine/threonine protein kinase [Lachnospiraceae bacterium]